MCKGDVRVPPLSEENLAPERDPPLAQGQESGPPPARNGNVSEESTAKNSIRRRNFSVSLTPSPDFLGDPANAGASSPSPPSFPSRGGRWCPQHRLSQSVPPASTLKTKHRRGSPNRIKSPPSQVKRTLTPPGGSRAPQTQKISGCQKDSLAGRPFIKMGGSTGPNNGFYGGVAQNHEIMVPWYQYRSPVSPWVAPWETPYLGDRFFIPPPAPSSQCCFHYPPAGGTPSTPIFPPTPSSIQSSQFSLHENGGAGSSHPGHSVVTLPGRVAPTTTKTKDGSPSPPSSSHTATQSWVSIMERNPVYRGSLPLLGNPPVRCLQWLAQLPDDKCALLPISPPLTPYPYSTRQRSCSPPNSPTID